jgi:hypothetical protein
MSLEIGKGDNIIANLYDNNKLKNKTYDNYSINSHRRRKKTTFKID